MIHIQNKNILAPAPPGLPTTGVPLFPHNPPAAVVPPTDPRLLESKAKKIFFLSKYASTSYKNVKKSQKNRSRGVKVGFFEFHLYSIKSRSGPNFYCITNSVTNNSTFKSATFFFEKKHVRFKILKNCLNLLEMLNKF